VRQRRRARFGVTTLAALNCEPSRQVGLLDIDICGPSLPRMLGLEGEEVHQSSAGWSPVYVSENLGVMSIGFMLTDPNEAVVWRGPRKNGLIKQFLKDVDWGTLDYLVRWAAACACVAQRAATSATVTWCTESLASLFGLRLWTRRPARRTSTSQSHST
jgi:hypothetical protein